MTDSPGQRCVAEWRQNVAFAITCAAYNQPLMGMDWAKPQNRRWLEAADRLLEQLAPDIDALVRRERAGVIERLATEYDATAGHFLRKTEILRWLRARAAQEETND